MAEVSLYSSRPPDPHYPFFEGWTGARTLIVVYIAAEFVSYTVGAFAGLYLFLLWNLAAGPVLTLLITIMTLRAATLRGVPIWRRLVILSSLAVPLGIFFLTFTGGRGVARFFSL